MTITPIYKQYGSEQTSPRQLCLKLAALLLLIFSASVSQQSYAQETRYVSDVLFVPLRSGQGIEYRIVNAGLKSGSPLTFVEEGDSGEWSKVITSAGVEGWIRNQYLMSEQPAKLKLNKALGELATLKKAHQALVSENDTLKNTNLRLNSTAKGATTESSRMAEELEKIKTLSAGAIALEQRYTQLLEKHQLLQTEKDVLTAENESLKNDTRVNFMLYGVGILLLGVVLTFVIPAIKPKKQYSEWG